MKFIARRYSKLTLVLDPITVGIEGGHRVMKGMNTKNATGIRVTFDNKMYSTEDKQIIKLLKAHPGFGSAFFSDEPEAQNPSDEAILAKNEKSEAAAIAGSDCQFCGFKAKNEQGLDIHQRSCKRNPSNDN